MPSQVFDLFVFCSILTDWVLFENITVIEQLSVEWFWNLHGESSTFDKNNSIGFSASKNLDQNITNYYNLIYEYENDCLTAAIEYNKSYYADGDLKPDENIFFSIKIIPFGKISSPALSKWLKI